MHCGSTDQGKFDSVMASKANEQLQASLQLLQRKTDELYQQMLSLEDEIARREMSYATILAGGKDNPPLKVEPTIQAKPLCRRNPLALCHRTSPRVQCQKNSTEGAPRSQSSDSSSLELFQRKTVELHQLKCLLEDEIARIEMSTLTILAGGKDNQPQKVEPTIQALKSLNSCQVGTLLNPSSEKHCHSPIIKRRKVSEAVISSENSCQELADTCRMNNWILPRYIVLPSFVTGKFAARVTVLGAGFESTITSFLKNDPLEARQDAAECMLNTLIMQQAGEQQLNAEGKK